MKLRNVAMVVGLVLVGWSMTGCATLLNDDHKMVSFSSDPENATVKVEGIAMGKTPCVIPVARKGGDKFITFERSGYKTLIVKLDNKIGGEGFGNLLFGGIIGIGIDAATGRAGTYQDSSHVILESGSGTISIDSKDMKEARDATKAKYEESQAKQSSDTDSDDVDTGSYSDGTQNWILNKDD